MFWKLLATCVVFSVGIVVGVELLAGNAMDSAVRSTLYRVGFIAVLCAVVFAGVWSRRHAERLQSLASAAAQWSQPSSRESIDFSAPHQSDDSLAKVAAAIDAAGAAMLSRMDAIDRQRSDLLALLESIPEGVIAIDPQQKILFVNSSAYRLFGLPPRKIDGQRIWEVIRLPPFLEAAAYALDHRGIHNAEIEMHSPPRVLSFHSRDLSVGPPGSMIVVLHDVSELRRLERVRQEFLANVSHELKTPLASIKAFTETLLEHDLDDRKIQIRFLRRIEEQADRLHALVIDMLTLARIESRDPHFDIRPVELFPVVRTCMDAFANDAAAKRVALTAKAPTQDFAVMADVEGLSTILRNLIDNAIKYTPTDGKVEIFMQRDGDSVRILVSDTGPGIPKADQFRIFERFYRVDKARSRELGGTGLGLSIVKHLVQMFGGTVSVQSEVQKGACFAVRLPIESLRNSTRPTPTIEAPTTAIIESESTRQLEEVRA